MPALPATSTPAQSRGLSVAYEIEAGVCMLPAGAECANYAYDTWPWAVTFGGAMMVLAQASAAGRSCPCLPPLLLLVLRAAHAAACPLLRLQVQLQP